MTYNEDRQLGIEMAKSLGAKMTAAVIGNKQSNFKDIFSIAVAEKGLDVIVAKLITGPPVWAHMALLHMPDLDAHHEALLEKAASEAPKGMVGPDANESAKVEEDFAREVSLGGPCSIMSLHNAMAADCQWTAKWMDGGYEQPTHNYSDWNKWLWSGTLTAGCGSTIALPKFAAKVPNSPLNKGDSVWIYVWVAGGSDLSGKNLAFKFTYDPGSTMTVFYNASGTTTINQLTVADYK